MGTLTVKVNDKPYPIVCDDGEEEHLSYLAEFVDKKVQSLAGIAKNTGESQLLLMAALLIADDLSQAYENIENLKGNAEPGGAVETEAWAERLEAIAEMMEKA